MASSALTGVPTSAFAPSLLARGRATTSRTAPSAAPAITDHAEASSKGSAAGTVCPSRVNHVAKAATWRRTALRSSVHPSTCERPRRPKQAQFGRGVNVRARAMTTR